MTVVTSQNTYPRLRTKLQFATFLQNFLEYEKKCRKQAALAKRRIEDELKKAKDPENPSYAPGHY